MTITNVNDVDIVIEAKKLFEEFNDFYSTMSKLPIDERKEDVVEAFGTSKLTNDCIVIYFWGTKNTGRTEWITSTKQMLQGMPSDPNTTMTTLESPHVILHTDTTCVLSAKTAFTTAEGTLVNYITVAFTKASSKEDLQVSYYHESKVDSETTMKME